MFVFLLLSIYIRVEYYYRLFHINHVTRESIFRYRSHCLTIKILNILLVGPSKAVIKSNLESLLLANECACLEGLKVLIF
jgi:hypothetical protein